MSHTSVICPFEGDYEEKKKLLEEVESYAIAEKLSRKKAMRLRLISEELLGMIEGIMEVREGRFWIDREEKKYEIHLTAQALVAERAEAVLLQASSTGKNEAYRGVTGKIRKALDVMTSKEATAARMSPQYMASAEDIIYWGFTTEVFNEWSYNAFREKVEAQRKAELWDELELSVLGKLADDIVVSVRPESIDIVVKSGLCAKEKKK